MKRVLVRETGVERFVDLVVCIWILRRLEAI